MTDSTEDNIERRIRFAPLPVPQRSTPSPIPPNPIPSSPIPISPSSLKQITNEPSKSNWLRPFLKRNTQPSSSSSINSSPLSSDKEDQSTPITDTEIWGIPLGRWTSAGSLNNKKSQSDYNDRYDLERTQSAQAYKTKFGRKGTRLLNGRVYGDRRANTVPNPVFQNSSSHHHPQPEPEFVEWGYGGMGSVRAGGGGIWRNVQSENNADIDDDDASGMAYLRRRREQRERERKEKEEKEKEKLQSEFASSHPVDPPRHSQTPPTSTEEHHVLRAVNLPAPRPGYHSRSSSSSVLAGTVVAPSRGVADSQMAQLGRSVRDHDDDDDDDDEDDEGDEEDEKSTGSTGTDDDDDDVADEVSSVPFSDLIHPTIHTSFFLERDKKDSIGCWS